jgi:hypothetical protein
VARRISKAAFFQPEGISLKKLDQFPPGRKLSHLFKEQSLEHGHWVMRPSSKVIFHHDNFPDK